MVAPRTPTETSLADVWGEILGLDGVGVQDRFVDLGGQSLSAMMMIAAIERRLAVRLSPRDLEAAGTIAELAELVDRAPHSAQTYPAPPERSVHAGELVFGWPQSTDVYDAGISQGTTVPPPDSFPKEDPQRADS
jgi:acyl carrier protein